MSKARALTLIALLFGLIVMAAGLAFRHEINKPAGEEDWIAFRLERGVSLKRVAVLLETEGIVTKPELLIIWARVTGNSGKLQAGDYLLSPSMTPVEVLDRIVSGRIITVTFTVPEGFRMKDIAGLVQRRAGIDSVAFMRACSNDSLARACGVYASSLEGYLFPDTYTISPATRPDRLAALMVSRLFGLIDEVDWDEELTRLSIHQILTLASIIEKETQLPEEREKVAAVYLNRLRIGMKLDADPTVIYGIDRESKRLTYEDLRHQSPYNTYINPGLPPGPICSPGLGCIRAAIHPDRSCKALYFVARGDGSHVFSVTFEEHNRAVREYRRRRTEG